MPSINVRRFAALLTLLGAAPLEAQMAGMSHMDHHAPQAPVTAKAKRQIDSVAQAVARLGSARTAAQAGFQPRFGWIPTMGTHWVSRDLTLSGRQTNRATPSQLMFSKINGRDSLVGAAYGYLTADNDTVRPTLFDGAPRWHDHPDLAPAGLDLVMLHVWFVPSPDGPFAGTNPNLPFWALGLAEPDSSRMRDATFSLRVRKASLALAEVADSLSVLPTIARREDVAPSLGARRDSIRTLIVPELLAAQKAHDSVRWDRAAARAAAQWDAIYASYLASARTEAGKARIAQYVAMLLGQHGE